MTAQPEKHPRPVETESLGAWARLKLDSEDRDAIQLLLGVGALLVGAWILAPALALLLLGGLLIFGVLRNR